MHFSRHNTATPRKLDRPLTPSSLKPAPLTALRFRRTGQDGDHPGAYDDHLTADPCHKNAEEENVVGRSSVEAGDE